MLSLRIFRSQPWLQGLVASSLLLASACDDDSGSGKKTPADTTQTTDTLGADGADGTAPDSLPGTDVAIGTDTLVGTDILTATDIAIGTDAEIATDIAVGTDTVDDADTNADTDTASGSDTTGSDTTGSDITEPTPAELIEGTPKTVAVSADMADAFFGVAYAANGNFYTTGWVALPGNPTPDQAVVVGKFLANGDLDTSFGTAGFATHNLAVGGTSREIARAVKVQSNGKIVAYATMEHDVLATGGAAADTDVAVVRFNTDGSLDTTFGTNGVVKLDLGTGVATSATAVAGADIGWGMDLYANDNIVLHAGAKGTGNKTGTSDPRTDLDWVVVRLTKDGALDNTFGTAGKFVLDIEQGNASPRHLHLLPDGSIIGSGYQNTPSLASTQPVLYKLTPNGALDVSFGVGGVYHQIGLANVTEAYAVAVQGDKLVTGGYGKNAAADQNDWLSLRLTSDGELDSTWGKNGISQLDAGGNLGENCRKLIVLPDGRPLLVGGGQNKAGGNTEGLIAVLNADTGAPDPTWSNAGMKAYELGGKADQFWDVALSPDQKSVVVVGLKGVAAADTTTEMNSDGVVHLIHLDPENLVLDPWPAPKTVAVSATMGDSFFGVAFGKVGDIFATGWVALPGNPTPDQAVVVGKFLANGDLDPSFGTAGFATHNLAVGGTSREIARAVKVQSSGKIVAYATMEHDVLATGGAAADTDVAVVRFNTNGTLDTTFGTNGVVKLDLGTGVVTSATAVAGADVGWGMSLHGDDGIILHAGARTGGPKKDNSGERTDLDWVVVRLTKDGALDTTFGTNGKFVLDIEEASASPRHVSVLADGSIIGSGYQNTPSFASVQPILYKLTPNGALDVSFGVGGVYHQIGLANVTEAYAVAVQGDKLVTGGYGKNAAADQNDWLSLRLTSDGELDPTWGKDGISQLDAGGNLGENCRNLIVLPDGRPLLVGGGQNKAGGNTEGLIAVLDAITGAPDSSWSNAGMKAYELGGKADQFWDVALSPDMLTVAIVGLKGVAAADTTASSNNDGVLFLIQLK